MYTQFFVAAAVLQGASFRAQPEMKLKSRLVIYKITES